MINSFVKVSSRNVDCSYNLSHEDLLAIIEDPKIVSCKEDAELFYAFKMKSYPTVRDSNETLCFDTLILDFDKSDESMIEILKRYKAYKYYFYTSFNHRFDKSTGEVNNVEKFRIILPLDKEYSATWFKYGIMKGIFDNCKIFKDADNACAKITQYYVPAITVERKEYYRFRYNDSDKLFSLSAFSNVCNDIVMKNARNSMKPKLLAENIEAYGQNLMRKYMKIVTQRCSERGTGVHAAICRVNAGLVNAKVGRDQRIAFMNQLFQPTCKGDKDEIENIAKSFGEK